MVPTSHRAVPQKSSLLRQLGFYSATALVVSNMVGTGIFATTGYLSGDLGDARWILLEWLAGAVFAFCGALSYSELGINFPSSGGEYVYLTRAYGPIWGFMTGWISFFAGFSAPIAAAALAFSGYMGHFYPAFQESHALWVIGSGTVSLKLGGAQLLASALIIVFTALNCFGIGRAARIQNVLTGTKMLVIVVFVVAGLLVGTGSWDHFHQPAVRTSLNSLPVQLVISLLWVMVAYSGWNAATYVAEELKSPHRTLPAALAAGTALVTLLYFGLNVVFIYATPLEQMKGVLAIGPQAAVHLFGPGVGGVFAALMALSITSTVNAMVTIGPRVSYAMAKNRAFFRAAATVDPRWNTPVAAIVSQGICSVLMTLTPFPQLVLYIGFSLTFFTVLSVASLFIFRRNPHWERLGPVNFLFPLIPAAYIAVGVMMIGYGIIWQPTASLTALVTIGLGAVVYQLVWREKAAA